MMSKNNILLPLVLFVVSIALHFAFLGQPAQVVFDEVHYGKTVNGYLSGEYFFTGHPPLGPQLTTLGAWFGGYREPSSNFEHIGQDLDSTAFAIRILPAFAGTILPLVIFFFLRTLGLSLMASFAAAILVLLENALLLQSRLALPDIFLILFGFLGLVFLFRRSFFLSAIFLSLSVAVKWNAVGFLIFAGFILLKNAILHKAYKPLLVFIVLPPLLYLGIFALHFQLLPNPGSGDIFMSQEFLRGEKNLIEKTIELNKTNYATNLNGLDATHPYSSKWYTWPLMQRPIFYWNGENTKLYLLGNPVIWWGSSMAVLLLIGLLVIGKLRRDPTAWILLLGYGTTLLPFVGVSRIVFLYHYFTPLLFAIMILAYLVSKTKHANKIFVALIVLALAAFVYFAPLTYGLELSPEQYENRVWFTT